MDKVNRGSTRSVLMRAASGQLHRSREPSNRASIVYGFGNYALKKTAEELRAAWIAAVSSLKRERASASSCKQPRQLPHEIGVCAGHGRRHGFRGDQRCDDGGSGVLVEPTEVQVVALALPGDSWPVAYERAKRLINAVRECSPCPSCSRGGDLDFGGAPRWVCGDKSECDECSGYISSADLWYADSDWGDP